MAKFRNCLELKKEKFHDEGLSTVSSRDQIFTEVSVEKQFDRFEQLKQLKHMEVNLERIFRERHIVYLEHNLQNLSQSYQCLDASRPWLIYWIMNAANLLNFKFDDKLLDRIIDFLIKCRHPELGGFAGGPGQYPHLAPTYAAVNALCIIGTERAYEAINRDKLKEFLWAVREPETGAFRLHIDGETDVRGAYCAISCSKLTSFSKLDEDKLFENTADWIASCQTYEGGFGGAPDLEAHGGYTFCGLAGIVMLGATDKCDVDAVLKWSVNRQMRYEGGFQGRTNKLVDGCYSFWVGAIIPIAQAILAKEENLLSDNIVKKSLYDGAALQQYILLCCQNHNGGLLDKPGKGTDLYHTCYTLSGVSIAQHYKNSMEPFILGDPNNELIPTHPLHNVPPLSVINALKYFSSKNVNDFNETKTDDRKAESS